MTTAKKPNSGQPGTTDAAKPQFAAADPNILAQQAQAQQQHMQQQIDMRKNMLLGVAVHAPFTLADVPMTEDAAMSNEDRRLKQMRQHSVLCVRWAETLTSYVHQTVEANVKAEQQKQRAAAMQQVEKMKRPDGPPN